jgi:hypothetical protein
MDHNPIPPVDSPREEPAAFVDSAKCADVSVYKDISSAIFKSFTESFSLIQAHQISGISSADHYSSMESIISSVLPESFHQTKNNAGETFREMFLVSWGLGKQKVKETIQQTSTISYPQRLADSYVGTISGFSAFLRNFISLFPVTPPQMGGFSTSTPEVAGFFAAEASAMNLFAGCAVAAIAAEEIKKAKKGVSFRDEFGLAKARMNLWRGYFQSLAGLALFVQRPTAGYCTFENINSGVSATTTIGKSAFYSGVLGIGFSAICLLALAVNQIEVLAKITRSARAVGAGVFGMFFSKSVDESLEFFRNELKEGGKETWVKLQKKYKNDVDAIGDALLQESHQAASYYIENVYKTVGGKNAQDLEKGGGLLLENFHFSEEVRAFIIEEFKDCTRSDWNAIKNLSDKELLGLHIAHTRRKEVALIAVESAIGADALGKIQSCLANKDVSFEEKKGAIEVARSCLCQNAVFRIGLLLAGAVGFVVMVMSEVLGFVVCAPLLFANFILTAFVTGLLTVLNVQELRDEWNKEGSVSNTEMFIGYGTLLAGIGCLVGIIVFSSATLGTGPVILSMAAVIIWVVLSGVYVKHLHKKRKEYQENHCSIEDLIGRVKNLQADIKLNKEEKIQASAKKIGKIVARKLEESIVSSKDKLGVVQGFFNRRSITNETDLDEYIKILEEWKKKEEIVKKAIMDFLETQLQVQEAKSVFDALYDFFPLHRMWKNPEEPIAKTA